MRKVDCLKCKQKNSCCDFGAWVDLEEAKKIKNKEKVSRGPGRKPGGYKR